MTPTSMAIGHYHKSKSGFFTYEMSCLQQNVTFGMPNIIAALNKTINYNVGKPKK